MYHNPFFDNYSFIKMNLRTLLKEIPVTTFVSLELSLVRFISDLEEDYDVRLMCIYLYIYLPLIQNWRNSTFIAGNITQIHMNWHEANILGMHLSLLLGIIVSASLGP